MATKISPISGFPEYLPAQQLAFNGIAAQIRQIYEGFGYAPLETPAVERIDTLISKGIDSKEVYALRRLNTQGEGDDGAKNLALRFDLTVPLARYVSQHYANLVFPFRRYQMQPVWRGERAQKGRHRQFYQFDIDYVAENTLPLAADAEILAAAHTALQTLGVRFVMRVNNRKLLQGLFEEAGFTGAEQAKQALKVWDDFEKLPPAEVETRLRAIAPRANVAGLTRTLAANSLAGLATPASPLARQGLEELRQVLQATRTLLGHGGELPTLQADFRIARGLDYYTGTVVETTLVEAPEFGSICSGGRYDNLAESLSERKLPGVGISIGISRLFDWLSEQPAYRNLPATPAHAALLGPLAAQAAGALRTLGLKVEMALESGKPNSHHFQAAQKRGLAYALVAEEDGTLTLRTLATRQDEKGLTPAQAAGRLAPAR